MPNVKDLSGLRFGKLVALSREQRGRKSYWLCQCDCGKTSKVQISNLVGGHTSSCGCNRLKKPGFQYKKRKLAYNTWAGIKQRTTNPKCPEFKWYGGRGISMCTEWMNSFDAFHSYVASLPRTGTTLDRIDTNGNYEPGNVRWATHKQQANNTRSNHTLDFNGRSMTIAQWSDEIGISAAAIHARVGRLGWSVERALTELPKPDKRRIEVHAVQVLGVEFLEV